MIVDHVYTDEEIRGMLEMAALHYLRHKSYFDGRKRVPMDVKRRRSEAVWAARRHGWKLKQIAHVLGLSISRTSVL